jgi:hypothetical protein
MAARMMGKLFTKKYGSEKEEARQKIADKRKSGGEHQFYLNREL